MRKDLSDSDVLALTQWASERVHGAFGSGSGSGSLGTREGKGEIGEHPRAPSLSLHPPAAPWTIHDYLASKYALPTAAPASPRPRSLGPADLRRSCTTALLTDIIHENGIAQPLNTGSLVA